MHIIDLIHIITKGYHHFIYNLQLYDLFNNHIFSYLYIYLYNSTFYLIYLSQVSIVSQFRHNKLLKKRRDSIISLPISLIPPPLDYKTGFNATFKKCFVTFLCPKFMLCHMKIGPPHRELESKIFKKRVHQRAEIVVNRLISLAIRAK